MSLRRLLVAFLAPMTFSVTFVAQDAKQLPSKNAMPGPKDKDPNQVIELRILPSKLVLSGAHDSRRVLVLGKLAGGGEIDLSRSAKFTALDDKIQIDADGFLAPVKEGEA